MADFSFRDIAGEDEEEETPDMPPPEGEEDWHFWNPESDDIRMIPGDSIDEAWIGLYYHEQDEWFKWILQGRADIVEDGYGSPITSAEVSVRVRNKVSELQE